MKCKNAFRFSSLAEHWGVHAKLIYKYRILYLDCITIVAWRHLVNDIDLCRSPKSPKKSINPLFKRSRSFNVIEFGANRDPVYDFLLVINSNLYIGPISHRCWDTATYWPKIANFVHPLSFSALVRGDTLRIYEKALRFLKLESSRQPKVKIWWS